MTEEIYCNGAWDIQRTLQNLWLHSEGKTFRASLYRGIEFWHFHLMEIYILCPSPRPTRLPVKSSRKVVGFLFGPPEPVSATGSCGPKILVGASGFLPSLAASNTCS